MRVRVFNACHTSVIAQQSVEAARVLVAHGTLALVLQSAEDHKSDNALVAEGVAVLEVLLAVSPAVEASTAAGGADGADGASPVSSRHGALLSRSLGSVAFACDRLRAGTGDAALVGSCLSLLAGLPADHPGLADASVVSAVVSAMLRHPGDHVVQLKGSLLLTHLLPLSPEAVNVSAASCT